MFKIAKFISADACGAGANDLVSTDIEMLTQLSHVESWSANLTTGMFSIGQLARTHHGLAFDAECGLLTLVRCYNKDDQRRILEILEAASLTPSRFFISTETDDDSGRPQSVICIGESLDFNEDGSGKFKGVFLFPQLNAEKINSVAPIMHQ